MRLSFAKYVRRMDAAFLTDYLSLLELLPGYEGLMLRGAQGRARASQPKRGEEAVNEILCRLNESHASHKGFVCTHQVRHVEVSSDREWWLTFERFGIFGGAENGMPGAPLPGEEAFAASCAEPWIAHGLCDSAASWGTLPRERSNAWAVYVDVKNQHRYEPHSNYANTLLDFWGEYPDDRRERACVLLETLRPLVAAFHPGLFTAPLLDDQFGINERTEAAHLAFVREADAYLIEVLGRREFSALLSPVDLSLDQWLNIAPLKGPVSSPGGILLPAPRD